MRWVILLRVIRRKLGRVSFETHLRRPRIIGWLGVGLVLGIASDLEILREVIFAVVSAIISAFVPRVITSVSGIVSAFVPRHGPDLRSRPRTEHGCRSSRGASQGRCRSRRRLSRAARRSSGCGANGSCFRSGSSGSRRGCGTVSGDPALGSGLLSQFGSFGINELGDSPNPKPQDLGERYGQPEFGADFSLGPSEHAPVRGVFHHLGSTGELALHLALSSRAEGLEQRKGRIGSLSSRTASWRGDSGEGSLGLVRTRRRLESCAAQDPRGLARFRASGLSKLLHGDPLSLQLGAGDLLIERDLFLCQETEDLLHGIWPGAIPPNLEVPVLWQLLTHPRKIMS